MAFGLACLGPLSPDTDIIRKLLTDCLYLDLKQPGSPSSLRDIAIRAWALAVVSEGGLREAEWTAVKAEISRRYGFAFGTELDEIALVFLLHAAMLSCGAMGGHLRSLIGSYRLVAAYHLPYDYQFRGCCGILMDVLLLRACNQRS